MDFTRKSFKGSFDPFWRGEAKVFPGGYKPTNDVPSGAVVKRGTPVEIDPETLTCKIAKSATVIEGGDATKLRVAKGLLFVVGDVITDGSTTSSGDGNGETNATTATITAIDTSNSDYDVLTVDTDISGTSIYVDCKPNGIVCADYEEKGMGILTLDVAYEAVILYKGLLAPIVDAWKDGLHLVGNPCIKLIVQ